MIKSPKIAILGFGREGKAVLRFLKKQGLRNVTILDKKFDKDYLKNLEDFNVIYRSPGVPYNLKEIQKAIASGVKFSSATDLFFKNAKGMIIGVTGTKGKGTTSTLIYKILKNAGKDVYLAGNIGKPAIDILSKLNKNSITVLELSSFQLQDLKRSPQIAVVLDMFPDHMDAHKNLKEYFKAKSSIAKYQTKKDRVFYAASNKYVKIIASKSKGKKIGVNPKSFKFFLPRDLKIRGEHNFKNAVMATTVALYLGIKKNRILKTVKNYRGLPYRLELIRTVKGVKIYNDSASTNPMTTRAAINSFREENVLIMGGKDKGLDYKPVATALSAQGGSTSGGKNSSTKLVVLFGENKNKIKKAISKCRIPVKLANNLKTALKIAYRYSKFYILNSKFLTIVFSPGAASFDMFIDYKARGKEFKKLVRNIK